MKINTIQISLVPTSPEETRNPVILVRRPSKEWYAEENGQMRGMYPYEIKLISMIQEHIITSWQ